MADVTLDVQGAVAGGVPGAGQAGSSAAQDWIAGIEPSRLTPRYYWTVGLMVAQEMFEFYDFFLVGYLVSQLAPGWHLTYGQSALMLLSSGVGAIVGSLVGGQIAANALAAAFYPTSVRATGVGWALGMGRVGSIVGPLVGGVLLAGQWNTGAVFLTAAGAALCAALAAFGLSRLTGGAGSRAVEQPTSFGAKLATEAKAGT